MLNRTSIIVDADLLKKLREIQAKKIKESKKSVSFSRIINDILRDCLKSKS